LGEITQIHVAVMGMMAQMALKDLGEKTKRGQLGRVLKGRIPAGIAYGYKIAAGDEGRGARAIDPEEAAVVRRIFNEFACGKSPETIARDLNREGAPGPGRRPVEHHAPRPARPRHRRAQQ
jgi:DNA invertase Pin-like site-specific DNA recombinase